MGSESDTWYTVNMSFTFDATFYHAVFLKNKKFLGSIVCFYYNHGSPSLFSCVVWTMLFFFFLTFFYCIFAFCLSDTSVFLYPLGDCVWDCIWHLCFGMIGGIPIAFFKLRMKKCFLWHCSLLVSELLHNVKFERQSSFKKISSDLSEQELCWGVLSPLLHTCWTKVVLFIWSLGLKLTLQYF